MNGPPASFFHTRHACMRCVGLPISTSRNPAASHGPCTLPSQGSRRNAMRGQCAPGTSPPPANCGEVGPSLPKEPKPSTAGRRWCLPCAVRLAQQRSGMEGRTQGDLLHRPQGGRARETPETRSVDRGTGPALSNRDASLRDQRSPREARTMQALQERAQPPAKSCRSPPPCVGRGRGAQLLAGQRRSHIHGGDGSDPRALLRARQLGTAVTCLLSTDGWRISLGCWKRTLMPAIVTLGIDLTT